MVSPVLDAGGGVPAVALDGVARGRVRGRGGRAGPGALALPAARLRVQARHRVH